MHNREKERLTKLVNRIHQLILWHRYRLIVFAILDDHNAHQNHNPEGNFSPFADEFAQ